MYTKKQKELLELLNQARELFKKSLWESDKREQQTVSKKKSSFADEFGPGSYSKEWAEFEWGINKLQRIVKALVAERYLELDLEDALKQMVVDRVDAAKNIAIKATWEITNSETVVKGVSIGLPADDQASLSKKGYSKPYDPEDMED